MTNEELPFEPGGDQRIDVPGRLIHMDVAGPGADVIPLWGVALYWRFPTGERIVVSGSGDTYEDALLSARRLLYVKHLSRAARERLTK